MRMTWASPKHVSRETLVNPDLGWSVEAVSIKRMRSDSCLWRASPRDVSRETSLGEVSGTGSIRSAFFRAAEGVCRPRPGTSPVESSDANTPDHRDVSLGHGGTEQPASRSRPPLFCHPTPVSAVCRPIRKSRTDRARDCWLAVVDRGVRYVRLGDDDRRRRASRSIVDLVTHVARCVRMASFGSRSSRGAISAKRPRRGRGPVVLGGSSPRSRSDRALT